VIRPLSPLELRARLSAGDELQLVDVREDEELALVRLEGALHIPLGDLAQRAGELDPDLPTVCICHHGVRSAGAAQLLAQRGFEVVYNLSGGIDRWAVEADPGLRRY
jgi:rhodanese-related sulfurtransferase